MTPILSAPWVERLGWALIHFLWQGMLIAGIYALVRLHITRPQSRYLLACIALLALMLAPAITFLTTEPGGLSNTAPNRVVGPPSLPIHDEWSTTPSVPVAAAGRVQWLRDFTPALVSAWFLGALIFWARLAGGCFVT